MYCYFNKCGNVIPEHLIDYYIAANETRISVEHQQYKLNQLLFQK